MVGKHIKEDDIISNAEILPQEVLPASLVPTVNAYIEAALADRTRKEYRTDLKRFLKWGGTLPASSELVAGYLAAHATTHAIATLQRWLVSIGRAHTTQKLPDPTKTEHVKTVFKGIRRQHGKPQRQVEPALRDDLATMIRELDDSVRSLRDRALLLLGFAGALRRSELVSLTLGDLAFSDAGLTVTLRRSKTDQEGRGRQLGIPFARDARLCPVLAVKEWLEHIKRCPPLPSPSEPLFRAINRHGQINDKALSGRSVALLIKERCLKAGLDPALYAGHSLRAGFCTAAALAGKPNWQIRKQSGHKTDVMLNRYIRDGRLFADNALEGVL